jgi:biopolymer transport protein ExbD
MAGASPAPTPTGRGGRRPLDATINLVPFIDLLSCCISFLLITAVWVQLARLDVSQQTPGEAGERDGPPRVRLTLHVGADGYLLSKSTGERREIGLRDGDYDYARLSAVMQEVKKEHGDVRQITLRVADGIRYSRVVMTMDQVIAVGGDRSRPLFPEVSLQGEGQGG